MNRVEYIQTGKTTKQMLDAVGGSIYIWPYSQSISYAIDIAHSLGRDDLKIYTVSDLRNFDRFRGMVAYGVVIDHTCYDLDLLGEREYGTLNYIKSTIRGEKP